MNVSKVKDQEKIFGYVISDSFVGERQEILRHPSDSNDMVCKECGMEGGFKEKTYPKVLNQVCREYICAQCGRCITWFKWVQKLDVLNSNTEYLQHY